MTKNELADLLAQIVTDDTLSEAVFNEKIADAFGEFLTSHPLYPNFDKGHSSVIIKEFNLVMSQVINSTRH